ncbi:PD-(D/E)XK motif protein, partial [Rahnella perminowiae]|uniref:PD-(D/E)XK motif protein n=1 Tax=Rahnella perminowiae TaxID=2816244 RepID=UPI001C2609A2
LRQDSHEKQNLVITLENKSDEDIFTLLLNSIIFSMTAADSSKAIYEVFEAIKRWKLFLASKRMHVLTPSQIRGLYAELTFLMTLLSEASAEDHQSILDAWKGPEKAQHDFIFNNIAIEIKSLNGDERSTVKISSEDQLESKFKKLSLKIYALGESEDVENRSSLNQLVEHITT